MTLDWLNTINSTSLKSVASTTLWAGTFLVFAIAVFAQIPVSAEFFGTWLFGLAGFTGVSAYQYGVKRRTDSDYVQAQKAQAAPAPETGAG